MLAARELAPGSRSGEPFCGRGWRAMDEDGEPFHLPTAQEREEEKKRPGGTDLVVIQKRMRECVRALGKFKTLAAKGRWVRFLFCFLNSLYSTEQGLYKVALRVCRAASV